MNQKEYLVKTEIIRKTFSDERKIKCQTPTQDLKLDENVHKGGDIFTTEEGEFIDFELQLRDFDEEELTKYVEFSENLYEKHQKHVSVYSFLRANTLPVCNTAQRRATACHYFYIALGKSRSGRGLHVFFF